jgi:hypothetical protein
MGFFIWIAEDFACKWLKVQATITIFSVGEVPSNAREKKTLEYFIQEVDKGFQCNRKL